MATPPARIGGGGLGGECGGATGGTGGRRVVCQSVGQLDLVPKSGVPVPGQNWAEKAGKSVNGTAFPKVNTTLYGQNDRPTDRQTNPKKQNSCFGRKSKPSITEQFS